MKSWFGGSSDRLSPTEPDFCCRELLVKSRRIFRRNWCHVPEEVQPYAYVPLSPWARQCIVLPPTVGKGAINVAFVRPPSVRLFACLSLCLSVRPSIAFIANNSRTQRPSVPKFEMKVPHFRCDSHTSFNVKWLKGLQTGGDIPCRPNPAAFTACLKRRLLAK